MNNVTLGRTGITVPQNAFGVLPIQRVSKELAVTILRRAYEGGMRYFDTA
ncbi:MAG TPA: aldo/keto reductase, partial [Selenomonas sp.]|nr:aldo/keto reductase [Selenomonas sp.]